MLQYNSENFKVVERNNVQVYSFLTSNDTNADQKTINSFSDEWNQFDHFEEEELDLIGSEYFDIVDEKMIDKHSIVLDVGCGTGRWSKFLAKKVQFIEAIDPSDAVFNAKEFNKEIPNIRVTQAGVDSIPFANESFDFVFSLGVLHHIPDTQLAMQQCVEKLKPGGYFLVYLYYKFDNKGFLFKSLFQMSALLRSVISKLPFFWKKHICNFLAYTVYFPFARFSLLLKKVFPKKKFYLAIPLSYYHDKSFFIMKNDSLDRFGTPLEQRFTKKEITAMMTKCGLKNIVFSDSTPYWHAIGQK